MDDPGHEATFLSEIAARPQDSEPRWIYADWLDDLGDQRGSFLRQHLALQSLRLTDSDFPVLQGQLRELATEIDPHWLSRIGYNLQPVACKDIDLGEMLEQHRLVVVRFWALWSGPCRQMRSVIEDVSASLSGVCQFVESDIDTRPELARSHGITSIPTILIYSDGIVVDRRVGVLPKSTLMEAIGAAMENRN